MHDVQLEQALVGFVLLNNSAISALEQRVRPDDFFEPLHRQIWEICLQMVNAGKKVSPLTVTSFLPTDLKIGDMPVKQYLIRLAGDSCMPSEASSLADALRDLGDKRAITEIGLVLRDAKGEPLETASWAIDELDKIASARSDTGTPAVTIRESVVRAIDAAAVAFQHSGKPRGLSYGLRALDERTLGAHPGHLVVLAGRPGMGKTAIALGMARAFAEQGAPVWFYSAEMGDVDLTTRMIADRMWSRHRRLTYWQISAGRYHEDEFQRIVDAGRALAELPVKIEQQPGLTWSQIAARARQHKRRHGLKAVFVDHLGLVKPSGRYSGNKVYETGEITQGAKALAKELEVPVILLCQINRGVEAREDKRPSLSDLRNSGDIEQDADTVMILYRAAYYEGKKEPRAGTAEYQLWVDQMEAIESTLELALEKNRHGPPGVMRFHCDIPCNVVRDEVGDMDDSYLPEGVEHLA
jgi:replicative DNA helicase